MVQSKEDTTLPGPTATEVSIGTYCAWNGIVSVPFERVLCTVVGVSEVPLKLIGDDAIVPYPN